MTTAQIELEELSVGADYEKVANRFRPIFEKIAQGAIQQEKERILPFEPIQWLKEAKLGAVRIPRKYGGDGVSLPQLFQLLAELAEADSNIVQALRGHLHLLKIAWLLIKNILRKSGFSALYKVI